MFWRFGGYANISTIDSVLEKPDVTLEEVLDESDLLQELKQHNTKLIEYLRDDTIFQRLLDYVTTTPVTKLEDEEMEEEEEDELKTQPKSTFSPVRNLSLVRSKIDKSNKQEEREEREQEEKTRQKYAFVASEILSSEVWSITETLMESRESLKKFWQFIHQPPALDPVTAGYFTKINETLLDKKTEQMLDFVKSLPGIVPAMLQHIDCPMIMDLLLKIISMEKAEGGQGIVDWLQSQDLISKLLSYLSQDYPTFTQTSAGDFIKAIITISANASQNEQSCIGPNSLTRQLVSESCIKPMIANMLKGGNSLTVGVGIIIEVIRKNNSDYDPEVMVGQELPPSSSDPIYLGNLLRQFAIHVPRFMELILSSKHTVSTGDTTISVKRKELPMAFGKSIEPLGFDRFKTCELMAELLHCSNMALLNSRGSEAHMQQRDVERENLRAEGRFTRVTEPPSATTEFSDDNDPSAESLELVTRPSESKQNDVNDDDGFEDVGASGDLADEIREEIDGTELASPLRPSKSRLSLEDEFFDEPLHSPPKPNSFEARSNSREPVVETVDPQTKDSEGTIDKSQQRQKNNKVEPTSPRISITDDLVAEIDAHLSPTKEQEEPSTKQQQPPKKPHPLTIDTASPQTHSPGNMSPHSEDTPAPLFSPQKEESKQVHDEHDGQVTPTQPNKDGEARWTDQSMREWTPHVETDLDGQPIVGDFLKMQFAEHHVVPTILDFFFRFPWNNFLHNVVYDVVQQVFNGTMERGYNRALAIDLFTTGRITERVIEGQLRSDEAQARSNLRLGYMGHLTLIAEEVVKFSERHPIEIISEPVLDKVTEKIWTDYVENTLAETRDRDNAILGGVRPDAVGGGGRQAVLDSVHNSSNFSNTGFSALANAGLNGGTTALDSMDPTNQSGGNFLASGSLLSGFGSSSDEEDEDMEEITERDGGSDQSRYTPTGAQAISLFRSTEGDDADDSDERIDSVLKPSLLGISDVGNGPQQSSSETKSFLPPPLKISPSRARRQLAVRLAQKEKERQEEQEKASTGAEVDAQSGGVSTATGGIGGIFSPTEGRTSTPDTPAFTAGGKIHERGLRANRRAAAGTSTANSSKILYSEEDVTSPQKTDDGFSDEDTGDDPWASLDAAAEAVSSSGGSGDVVSGGRSQDEGSWFGSSFSSKFTNDGNGDSRHDHDDEASEEGEEVVIGLANSPSSSSPATTTRPKIKSSHSRSNSGDPQNDLGISVFKTDASSSKNDDKKSPAASPTTDTRPRSPKDGNSRSAMSRLFQSWQAVGAGASGTSAAANAEDEGDEEGRGS